MYKTQNIYDLWSKIYSTYCHKNLIKKYILCFKNIKNHVKIFNILEKIMNQ